MFWDNFVLLCAEHNTNPNAVCSALHLSNATATHWKNGSIPRDTTLKKVADYFNVKKEDLVASPNILIKKEEGNIYEIEVMSPPTDISEQKEKPSTEDEELNRLLKITDNLSDENLQKLLDYGNLLLKSQD